MLGTMLAAIRMHARVTGDTHRARLVAEELAGVTWDPSGRPALPGGSPIRETVVALADLLILDGDQERGRRLLAELIARMYHEVNQEARPEFWYFRWNAVALALNGDRMAAIEMLERSLARGQQYSDWWWYEAEPAFDGLTQGPAVPGPGPQGARSRRRTTARTRPYACGRAGARSHRRAVRTWRLRDPPADTDRAFFRTLCRTERRRVGPRPALLTVGPRRHSGRAAERVVQRTTARSSVASFGRAARRARCFGYVALDVGEDSFELRFMAD